MAQKRRSRGTTKSKRKKAPKRNYVMRASTIPYNLTGFDAEMEKLISALRQAGESKLADELTEDKDALKSRDRNKIIRLLKTPQTICNENPVLIPLAFQVIKWDFGLG